MLPALHRGACDATTTARAIESSLKARHQSPHRSRRKRFFDKLPIELWQLIMDLLPSFGERKRLCMVCKMALTSLEWRLAPPLQPSEDMIGLDLGDVGARAVAWAFVKPQPSMIGELSLGNNNIGNAGVLAIAALLRAGCAIRRLSLRDNAIGDAGARALAAALAENKSLEELDLWGNNITSVGKAALLATAKCKVFLESSAAPSEPSLWVRLADSRMRTVLFEWISQVQTSDHGALGADADPQDVLFQTFSFIDTYFAAGRHIKRSELQLIGVACTLAATSQATSKAGREGHLSDQDLATWLAFVTDDTYTAEDVKEALHRVKKTLGFKMHKPTAYTFLRRYLRKTGWTQESFSLANYLIELAVMNGGFCKYSPQAIAAAAVILSRQYLSQGIGYQNIESWKAKLLRCAHIDTEELIQCTAALSRLHVVEQGRPYRFVNKKYMWHGLHMVAKLKPNPPVDAQHLTAYLYSKEASLL